MLIAPLSQRGCRKQTAQAAVGRRAALGRFFLCFCVCLCACLYRHTVIARGCSPVDCRRGRSLGFLFCARCCLIHQFLRIRSIRTRIRVCIVVGLIRTRRCDRQGQAGRCDERSHSRVAQCTVGFRCWCWCRFGRTDAGQRRRQARGEGRAARYACRLGSATCHRDKNIIF